MGHGKRAGENDESAIRFARDLLDGIFEIGSAAHGKRNYLHTRRQGPFKVRELPLHGVCRIVNNSNADCTWRYFPEHPSPFCSEAVLPEGEPGYVASRSRWARDQAGGDRIAHLCEYDRQGAGSVLQRHHGRLIAGENSIRPHPHEFDSEASQALVIPAWPALLDVDIATFDPPEILQAPAERRHAELAFGVLLRQPRNQHADAVHLLALLRARRERPRGRAAEECDEFAPSHVDFALPLIASPSRACHPASLIFTRAASIILPPATMRSACADASPARTSSISSSAVYPFANISASVQPSGDAASSSRARRRSGLGPRRRR